MHCSTARIDACACTHTQRAAATHKLYWPSNVVHICISSVITLVSISAHYVAAVVVISRHCMVCANLVSLQRLCALLAHIPLHVTSTGGSKFHAQYRVQWRDGTVIW
eukprot:3083-Heterococcus_DN1.PRE.1